MWLLLSLLIRSKATTNTTEPILFKLALHSTPVFWVRQAAQEVIIIFMTLKSNINLLLTTKVLVFYYLLARVVYKSAP